MHASTHPTPGFQTGVGEGSGFRVLGLGFRVLGFRVLGFRVLGFRVARRFGFRDASGLMMGLGLQRVQLKPQKP